MHKSFKILIKDHTEAKKMTQELMDTTAKAKVKRTKILGQLKHALQTHEHMEEKYLYPLLVDERNTHDLTLEAYQEHHILDILLYEMQELNFTDERWKAKLTVLQENLIHHIEEEETELFAKAEKIISVATLDSIAEQFEAIKKTA